MRAAVVAAFLALTACSRSHDAGALVVSGCRPSDPAYVVCVDGGEQ